MKAPFPWFGGKRRVASLVWEAIGDVENYVEPFAGSLAVLLERPSWHHRRVETVNDLDGYLVNFWRAVAAAPEEVAHWCDWPVNESDLVARHRWLVAGGRARLARLESEPDYYDSKVAGWWLWGICAWIGSGWCAVTEKAVRHIPHLGSRGNGLHAGTDMTRGGSGAPANIWHPELWRIAADERSHYGYFRALASRLRDVRVCCGDWSRVISDGALSYGATVGILLDPPYTEDENVTGNLYGNCISTLARDARDWAIRNGQDRRLRIVLCGYETEHIEAMPASWRMVRGQATAAYQTRARAGATQRGNQENRHKERLWFSPGCVEREPSLFADSSPKAAGRGNLR